MKRFFAMLLILIIALSCVACGVPEEKCFVKIDEYKTPTGYLVSLVYDPETKVEYFMRGDLMCPRYDEHGNITFYEGE